MAKVVDRRVGKWRIIETSAWDRAHLDLVGPAFIVVEASLDCGFTPNGIDFEWNGADEGDQVCGEGWADLRDDGFLEGEISYHNGDEATFIAAPWKTFSATC